MELEDALYRWAAEQAALTAILGVPGDSPPTPFRLWKLKVPQASKFPATVMQRNGVQAEVRYCKRDGAVGLSVELRHYGKTATEAWNLARQWRLELEAVSWPTYWGDPSTTLIRVKAAEWQNEFDVDEPEPGLLARVQLWRFWVWQP